MRTWKGNLGGVLIAALICLLAGFTSSAAPRYYRLTDLGSLAGAAGRTYAYGMNGKGDVVGYTDTPGGGGAFLWSNGAMQGLGSLYSYDGVQGPSEARGINDLGQVVGIYTGPFGTRSFIWASGSMRDLGALVSGPLVDIEAYRINNRSQVVGNYYLPNSPNNERRAFIWQNGAMQELANLGSPPSSGPGTAAYAINDRGEVVGHSTVPPSTDRVHAVLWIRGAVYDLGNLTPAGFPQDGSVAFDINNRGQIVGYSATGAAPFLWDNGSVTDLEGLSPDSFFGNAAMRVNNRGQVVGYSAKGGGNRAFLWEQGTLYDLNDLIDASDPLHDVITLRVPFGIDDAGRIVVNAEISGIDRAVLLTPTN